MTATAALAIIAVAITTTASAQQDLSPGRIERSIKREASRLAVASQPAPPHSDWSALRRLSPGTRIIVATPNGFAGPRMMVRIDDDSLVVINDQHPAVRGRVAGALRDAVAAHPDDFSTGPLPRPITVRGMRIGPEAIFHDARKIVDLAAIVERIDRANVGRIDLPAGTRASTATVIGGIAAGIGFGIIAMGTTIDCPYAGNCEAWQLRRSAPFWLPMAGGLVGYWGSRYEIYETIYRRSIAPAQ